MRVATLADVEGVADEELEAQEGLWLNKNQDSTHLGNVWSEHQTQLSDFASP
jgi:hypothetical protein